MTLVIMAAGMGSRYGGLKQIDPIGPNGEFIVDYSIYDAMKSGFDRVVFIIKEENLALFRQTVGNRIENHIKVEYVFQKMSEVFQGVSAPAGRTNPWGTGHAVYSCAKAIDDNFAVINADDFYGIDSFEKLSCFLKNPTGSSTKEHFCMAGFVLENTLTENGHVARGVCEINENSYLTNVTERTKIQKNHGKVQYFENDVWTSLSAQSTVSMNCWGFTPALFPQIEKELCEFFDQNKDHLEKAEFYLPFVVQDLINKDFCDVKVLKTSAKWYGVTYHEDKAKVVKYIQTMIKNKSYPEKLW